MEAASNSRLRQEASPNRFAKKTVEGEVVAVETLGMPKAIISDASVEVEAENCGSADALASSLGFGNRDAR